MKKEPILVIMAAGMGSRFGGLKQMEPISDKGEIILDFSLYDAVMAGFRKAIFVIKKENEDDFRALIDEKAGKYIDVAYAYQELTDLPQGYTVPEGARETVGNGTCGTGGEEARGWSDCGHQRGRLLRTWGISDDV